MPKADVSQSESIEPKDEGGTLTLEIDCCPNTPHGRVGIDSVARRLGAAIGVPDVLKIRL